MDYSEREIMRNLLSVVAGVLGALAWGLTFLVAATLISFNPGTTPGWLQGLSTALTVAGWIGAPLLGGYITALLSTRRTTAHLVITGLVLILLTLWTVNFRVMQMPAEEKAGLLLLVPLVITGGRWQQRRKAQR